VIKASCEGKLFGGLVDCYVLEDGRRVVSRRQAGVAPEGIADALIAAPCFQIERPDGCVDDVVDAAELVAALDGVSPPAGALQHVGLEAHLAGYEIPVAEVSTPMGPRHRTRRRRARGCTLYLIQADGTDLVKIGCAKDVAARLAALQTGCPLKLRLVATRRGSLRDERRLHQRFVAARVSGEWFRFSDEIRSAFGELAAE
jgi:hypothetical protein